MIRLYLVEDSLPRVLFFRDVLAKLNSQEDVPQYEDGFAPVWGNLGTAPSGEDWASVPPNSDCEVGRQLDELKCNINKVLYSAKLLAQALQDDEGLLLLDLRLHDPASADLAELETALVKQLGLKNDALLKKADKIQKELGEQGTRIGAVLLAAALVSRRPHVLVSGATAEETGQRLADRIKDQVTTSAWPTPEVLQDWDRDRLKSWYGTATDDIGDVAANLTWHKDPVTNDALRFLCLPWSHERQHEWDRMWQHDKLQEPDRVQLEAVRDWLQHNASIDDRSAKALLMTSSKHNECPGLLWVSQEAEYLLQPEALKRVFERLELDVKVNADDGVCVRGPCQPSLPWFIAVRALVARAVASIEAKGETRRPPTLQCCARAGVQFNSFALTIKWDVLQGEEWKLPAELASALRAQEQKCVDAKVHARDGARDDYPERLEGRREQFGVPAEGGGDTCRDIVSVVYGRMPGLDRKEVPDHEVLWQLARGWSSALVAVEWPTSSRLVLRWFGKIG